MSDAAWIVLAGSLVAAACSLVGSFLVLRRLAMLGDAISHAVLPGIVAAFLLAGSRSPLPMLLGAGALGLLTAVLADWLTRHGVREDASIGVTFTWLFALGVILVSRYAGQVDLDADCVLYGDIVFTPLDTWSWGGRPMGPRAIWILGAVTLANLVFVALCWKPLKVCAFDPVHAASLGFRVWLWHYLLTALVSVTCVASFESVGAILVVAMLVIPPNTAYLLTDRLGPMVVLAVVLGVAAAGGGWLLAARFDASVPAAMALVSGGLFLLAALFSPSHGVVIRALARRRVPATPAEEPPGA